MQEVINLETFLIKEELALLNRKESKLFSDLIMIKKIDKIILL